MSRGMHIPLAWWLSLALTVCLCAVAPALALQLKTSNLQDLEVCINHLSTVYLDGYTYFRYNITTHSYRIGQFAISAANCEPSDLELQCNSNFEPYGHIKTLQNFLGFSFPYEQYNQTSVTYELGLKGMIGTNEVTWAIASGDSYATTSVLGPDCSADNQYPEEPELQPEEYSCSAYIEKPQNAIDKVIPGSCAQSFTIQRTFLITSPVGLTTEANQIIKVIDNEAPNINSEDVTDLTLECDRVIPDVPSLNATDNCDPEPHINSCEARTNGTCPMNYFLARTWTAVDNCGNSKCFTYTISVVDTTKPVLLGLPPDQEIECDLPATQEYPPVANVTAIDNCGCLEAIGNGDNEYVLFEERRMQGTCRNTYALSRTWTARDCCGHQTSHTQTITVKDTTKPVLTIDGSDYVRTYECSEKIPYPVVNVSDACMRVPPPITLKETIIPGSCNASYVLKRVWSATDDCGNRATLTRFYSVRDTTKPVFVGTENAQDQVVECGYPIPLPEITAIDNCSVPTVEFCNETIPSAKNIPSEYVIKRTWTATDSCGNTANYTQTITVVDTIPPVINMSQLPEDSVYQCAFDVPQSEFDIKLTPLNTDLPSYQCDKKGYESSEFEEVINGSCPNEFIVVLSWVLTDAAGNSAYAVRYITVNDTTKPQLLQVPCDTEEQCDCVTPPPVVSASDNCGCSSSSASAYSSYDNSCLEVEFSNETLPGSCEGDYTIVRKWSVTDACGNTNQAYQNVYVKDTTAPTFTYVPKDEEQSCELPIDHPMLTATDNCGEATVDNEIGDEQTDVVCPNTYKVIQSWTACDDCGNVATVSRTISVYDNTAPQFVNVPEDTSAPCYAVPPPLNLSATDNCDPNVCVDFKETRLNGTCIGNYTLVRSWVATDACGNSDYAEQRIQVYDTCAPVFEGTPEDLYFECSDVNLPPPPMATDSCSEVKITDHSYKVKGNCNESYTIYRIFQAVDDCGNVAVFRYTVVVEDKTPPELNIPADASYECSAPCTLDAVYNATDNCSPTVTVWLGQDVIVNQTCPYNYTVLRPFLATDDCGNEAEKVQVIEVRDITPPHFVQSPLPHSGVYSCAVPYADVLTATDSCGGGVIVLQNITQFNVTCQFNFEEERIWIATDACGLTTTHRVVVEAVDVTPPELCGVPNDTTVPCNAVPPPPQVTATDECDPWPGVTFTEEMIYPIPSCLDTYTIQRTWKACDACGYATEATQTINVVDDQPPIFDQPNPGNQVVSCSLPYIPVPTAHDNCDNSTIEITACHYITGQTCANNFVFHVAFSAADRCGNVNWFNYTITVEDTQAPNVTWYPRAPYENFVDFECSTPSAPVPYATDNCDPSPTVVRLADETTEGDCIYREEIVRRWVISDQCNNEVEFYDKIRMVHNVPPQLLNTPAPDIYSPCDEEPPYFNVTAVDSCGMMINASFEEYTESGSCYGVSTLIRTWTATDACDLAANFTQNVHITDTIPPEFSSYPADTSLSNMCQIQGPAMVSATDKCDDKNPQVTVANATIPGPCSHEFTVVFTWTATDSCGNTNQHVQWINYTWNLDPVLQVTDMPYANLPTDLSNVDIASIPAPANISAFDGCGNELNVDFTETRYNGTCIDQFTLVRYWNTTDDCGLTASHKQLLYVNDKQPPVIEGVPPDETVECGLNSMVPEVDAFDNSNNVTLDFTETVINGSNSCDYKLVYTWTATDPCGNVATATQVVTVKPTAPAQLNNVPPNKMVNCPYEDEDDNVTASAAPQINGYCLASYPQPDMCYVNDSSASAYDYSLSININGEDMYLTFLDQSFAVTTLNDNLEITGSLQSTDDSYTVYNLYLVLSEQTDDSYTGSTPVLSLQPNCYVSAYDAYANQLDFMPVDSSMWTFYTMANGSLSTADKTTFVEFAGTGGQAAQFGPGASGRNVAYGGYVSLQQDNDMGSPSGVAHLYLGVLPAADCDLSYLDNPGIVGEELEVTVTLEKISGPCTGEATWIKTWTACSEPGYCTNASQTITILDLQAPEFSNVPPNVNITCEDMIPNDQPSVSDACDSYPTLTSVDEVYDKKCNNTYKIRRVWTATDSCGNNATAVQIISVYDNNVPMLVGVPTNDMTVQCPQIPDVPTVTASDDCQAYIEPMYSEESTPGSCPNNYVLTRTWSATDNCGNTASAAYDITVVDTIAPELCGVPADLVLECGADIPDANVTATDLCDQNVDVSGPVVVVTPGKCPGVNVVQRTWTATDCCGNSACATQTIKFTDTTPPMFNPPLPTNCTVECNEVPEAEVLTALESCGSSYDGYEVNIYFEEVRLELTDPDQRCNDSYILRRTWTATDCSGLQTVYTIYITVIDTYTPVLYGVPESLEAQCYSIPTAPNVTAQDNCSNVTISFEECRTEETCLNQYVLVRTWTATDNCGNAVNASATIAVYDDDPPMFTSPELPSYLRFACNDTYTPPQQYAEDECSGGVTVECDVNTYPGVPSCPANRKLVYTWTATDACSNTASRKMIVEFFDDIPPTLYGVPDDESAECTAPPNSANVTATDLCDPSVPVNTCADEIVNQTCPNNYTVVRQWTATDACGNPTTATQYIYVSDTNPPCFIGDLPPNEVLLTCQKTEPKIPVLFASDNCALAPFSVSPMVNRVNGSCPWNYDLYVTWIATDACGLSAEYSQIIHVVDTTAPVLYGIPADTSCQCSVPAISYEVNAVDECDGNIDVTVSDEYTNGDCPYSFTLNRTWTACDSCGNEVSQSQIIVVEDTQPPYFLDEPYGDLIFSCDDVPSTFPDGPLAADMCDPNVNVYASNYTLPGGCTESYTIVRIWKAVDACGNEAYMNQTITVVDDQPPMFINLPPPNITNECNNVSPAVFPDFSDNCQSIQLNKNNSFFVEKSTYVAGECQNYVIYRSWGVEDDCGLWATFNQTIMVKDTQPPFFTSAYLPENMTVECDSIPPAEQLEASDECGAASTSFEESEISEPYSICSSSYILQREWTACDLCGLTTTYVQFITVIDTIAPTLIGVPTELTIYVPYNQLPDPPNVTAVDSCGGAMVKFSEDVTAGGCVNNFTLVRTWMAVDDCGNHAQVTQNVVAYDTQPPIFAAPLPENEVLGCGSGIPMIPSVSAIDDKDVDVTVTLYQDLVKGECPANYTITRTWTASDSCGNSATYTQVVTVEDNEPPMALYESIICYQDNTILPTLVFEHVTELVGGLFNVTDSCSTFSIAMTGCTSNQDADLQVVQQPNGFNADCMYNSSTDTLTIQARLDWLVAVGRIFTVTAVATDACGLKTPLERQIWVPLDENSMELAYADELVDELLNYNSDCLSSQDAVVSDDTAATPCEYSNTQCYTQELGTSFDLLELIYDETTDTTEFVYVATFNQSVPERLVLGLDLTQGILVSYSPDVYTQLGTQDDTFVSGITFFIENQYLDAEGRFVLSFVLSGKLASAEDYTPYQFLSSSSGGGPCTSLAYAPGPKICCASTTGPTGSVVGNTYLTGMVDGSDFTARIPISGVPVLLRQGNNVTRFALTNEDGSYTFPNTPVDLTGYTVVVAAEGVLRPGSGFNQYETQFIYPQTPDPNGEYPYGAPQVACADSNDIFFVLADKETPGYAVPPPDGSFKKTGETSQFWVYEFTAYLQDQGNLKYTQERLTFLADYISTQLPQCNFNEIFVQNNPYLASAALNDADGKGVIEPYTPIQEFIISWAGYIYCAGAGQASDQQLAQSLLLRLIPQSS